MATVYSDRYKFERFPKDKYMIIYLIPTLLLLVSLPFVYGVQYQPTEYVSYEVLYLDDNNKKVHYWVVDDMNQSTCKADQGYVLYACSKYFESKYHDDYIWVPRQDVREFDRYGMTFLDHEKLHIICSCNFHFNESMRNLLQNVENPYDVVIKHKKQIKYLDDLYKRYN